LPKSRDRGEKPVNIRPPVIVLYDYIIDNHFYIYTASICWIKVGENHLFGCFLSPFKKGKKSAPGNYRPVSLTSVVCKVMESLVRDHMVAHMTENGLFSGFQHGFISGRSCATNLLAVLDAWTEPMDNGTAVDAVYLDFSQGI